MVDSPFPQQSLYKENVLVSLSIQGRTLIKILGSTSFYKHVLYLI